MTMIIIILLLLLPILLLLVQFTPVKYKIDLNVHTITIKKKEADLEDTSPIVKRQK
jgi:hypothetical protein